MGKLRVNNMTVGMTDEALSELQERLPAAFRQGPGLFLHVMVDGAPEAVRSVWVSPASEIVMTFDVAPQRSAPVIVGFDPWTDEDRDALG